MKTVKIALHFPPQQVEKPVVYMLAREYNLIFNILRASVSPGKKGRVIMEITGDEKDIEGGVGFIREQGVECLLLTDSVIRYEDKCVHCGACTAVCPTAALKLDANAKLVFDMDKCLMCGHCIRACPMRALFSQEDLINGG